MFVLLLILSIAFAVEWHKLDDYTFIHYQKEFKKMYSTKQQIRERQSIFETNLREIKQHNQDLSKTWKKGVNQFTDRTPEEFKMLLGAKTGHIKNVQPLTSKHLLKSVGAIDWRDYGIVSENRNQGQCGSCWSFSATESIESYFALKTGRLEVLSEQQILDCTFNGNHQYGCEGGIEELAYEQVIKMGGLATEWQYPYTSFYGQDFQCNKTKSKPAMVKLSDYVTLQPNDQDEIIHHLSLNGPLSVAVDASNWDQYENGIFNGCNQTNIELNHAVQLIGMSDTYWIIRNSWGTSWGIDGYIRLLKTDSISCGVGEKNQKICGTCGILYHNTYPIIA